MKTPKAKARGDGARPASSGKKAKKVGDGEKTRASANAKKKRAGARRRDDDASRDGGDGDDGSAFMPVPSFDGDGDIDLGGEAPAWESYDWEGEKSARKRAAEAAATRAAAAADPSDGAVAEPSKTRPKKRSKVDMRFGSEWDKARQRDKQYGDRREAKR